MHFIIMEYHSFLRIKPIGLSSFYAVGRALDNPPYLCYTEGILRGGRAYALFGRECAYGTSGGRFVSGLVVRYCVYRLFGVAFSAVSAALGFGGSRRRAGVEFVGLPAVAADLCLCFGCLFVALADT